MAAPADPRTAAQTGAVTLTRRFGSTLNLNIHFHLLVLDGVYLRNNERLEFRREAGQPGGRGGRNPGLADSAYGVF